MTPNFSWRKFCQITSKCWISRCCELLFKCTNNARYKITRKKTAANGKGDDLIHVGTLWIAYRLARAAAIGSEQRSAAPGRLLPIGQASSDPKATFGLERSGSSTSRGAGTLRLSLWRAVRWPAASTNPPVVLASHGRRKSMNHRFTILISLYRFGVRCSGGYVALVRK